MKISPPAVYAYDLAIEKAINIISDLRLRNCELLSGPVLMLGFLEDADLLHLKMMFSEYIDFANEFAFVRPVFQGRVESFLGDNEMASRVTRQDLIALAFWDSRDKVAFDTELYQSTLQP
jgi:hypothetical protein